MGTALLADRTDWVLPATKPPRARVRRSGAGAAGLAPPLVGPASIVASCVSLQTATALATTVFATYGTLGAGGLRFVAGAFVLLAVARPRIRGRSAEAWALIVVLG